MAIGKPRAALGAIGVLFNAGTYRDLTDGQLLERFATARGEAGELAFAALVERHGPMVLGVCRSVLRDHHDAHDAFQATFLVLVRRGRSLWVRDSLGPWLHQVAIRTAKCARASAIRRTRMERSAMPLEQTPASEADDFVPLLHEEINRLPERYRAAIVLCDLQGRTHEQAARHLGWPVGTVKSRQARGRNKLRDRLRRRGVAPESSAMLFAVKPGGFAAIVPPALAEAATRAAIQHLAPGAIAGASATLALEVAKTMTMTRWWKLAAAFCVAGATATGVPLLARQDGVGGAAQDVAKKPDEPTTTIVMPSKLRSTVIERGTIEASRTANVRSEVEGTRAIISIVAEGTAVKKGDLVLELDSATLRDNLTDQEIATRRAQADHKVSQQARASAELAVKEFEEGTAQEEELSHQAAIDSSDEAIKEAKARRDRSEQALVRINALHSAGRAGTSADIMAEVELGDRQGQAEADIAREVRKRDEVMRKHDIFRNYTSPRLRTDLEVAVMQKKSEELVKQASYELAKARVAKFRSQIEKCKLYAPNNGMVVYADDIQSIRGQPRQSIEEGATVRERQTLFHVFDLGGPMRVNVKVHESIVDRVSPGQTVKIAVDALPGTELAGVVKSVQPLPDSSSGVGSNPKLYTTFVEITDPPKSLRPGMTAKADILIGEADDALAVPLSAVVAYDGKWRVAVKTADGGREWREVTTGLYVGGLGIPEIEGRSIEIKTGLKPGETVFDDPLSLMTEQEKRDHLTPGTAPRSTPRKGGGRRAPGG